MVSFLGAYGCFLNGRPEKAGHTALATGDGSKPQDVGSLSVAPWIENDKNDSIVYIIYICIIQVYYYIVIYIYDSSCKMVIMIVSYDIRMIVIYIIE